MYRILKHVTCHCFICLGRSQHHLNTYCHFIYKVSLLSANLIKYQIFLNMKVHPDHIKMVENSVHNMIEENINDDVIEELINSERQ